MNLSVIAKFLLLGMASALLFLTASLVGEPHCDGIYSWDIVLKIALFIAAPALFGYIIGKESER